MTSPTYLEAKGIIAASSGQITLPEYTGGTTDAAYLKSYLLPLMTSHYGVDASVFETSTLASTTLIRDFLNKASRFQESTVAWESLEALGQTIAPAFKDVASLLRYPATGQCGEHNWQLYQIYKAFGFDAAWVGSVNGVGEFTIGHVQALVKVSEVDGWIVQDSYENFLFTAADGQVLSYEDARILAANDIQDLRFDAVDSYLEYSATGVVRPVTPENQTIILDAVFSLQYNVVYSIGGVQHTYGTSGLFPAYAGAYDPLVWQGGVFASQQDAVSAVAALGAAGLTWQAAANFLRVDHYATGFTLQPGKANASEWLTLRLSDGSYVSINYESLEVLQGSYEQLIIAASHGSLADGASFAASDFLGGFHAIDHDGYAVSDWQGREVLALNHSPNVEVVRRYAEIGADTPIGDLFALTDEDGDTASRLYVEVRGGAGGGSLVSSEGGTVASGGRFVSVEGFDDWVVRLGDPATDLGIFLRATDGKSWSGAVALELGVTGVRTDTNGTYSWSTLRWYDYQGQREQEIYGLDAGGTLRIRHDPANAFVWSENQLRYDASGAPVAQRYNYDAGGYLNVQFDVANAYVWSDNQLRYDASGALAAQRYTYDDGGYLKIQFDAANAYVWSNSQLRYDAAGTLVAQRYHYDGGGYLNVQFDSTNAYVWSNSQFRYDAAGALVAQRYNYDGGGYLSVQFDTTNAYRWSENQLRYDGSGTLLVQLLRFDDGSDTIFTNISYVLPASDPIELLRTFGSAASLEINLTGNAFANTIIGNNGANVLDGKGGADLLYGYGGGDTFAFTSPLGSGNVDTIGDFQTGLDRIALDDALFDGLPFGALAPGAFRYGAAALDADDRILYDTSTGALYFDTDGIGGAGGVQFAALSGAPVVALGDFAVI